MCKKIIGLMLSLLSIVWFGAACGKSPGGNADNGSISVAANSNSAKTNKQTDMTPVTIGIDALISEFENDPSATYQKYKERMMTVTGKLKSVVVSDGGSGTFKI